MSRVRFAIATVVACAAAAGLALALASGHESRGPGGATVSANGFAGAVSPPDVPPADFALRDQDDKLVSTRALRGRPVIVSFLYTHCQDTCPITAQQIRGALDQLGHDVPALAVSVDPPNDTAGSAKRFLLAQHVPDRIRFLLGTRAQLRPVWKAFGIQPQGKGFEHTARVVVLGKDGRQRVAFPTDELTPEGLAHDVRRLERLSR